MKYNPSQEAMIEDIIQKTKHYLPEVNVDRLRRAFEFADEAHKGQMRKDGVTPYIMHPLSAALYLTRLHVDEDTLIACVLHDVPEDTQRTLEDIEQEFGSSVAYLVEGITKLSKVHYRNNMMARQVESLKKLFIHSAKDPRVILIKLADRLHNMSTISCIDKPEKRKRIAKETMEIFVPVANLLGLWDLKSTLEDYCFEVLMPNEFREIRQQVLASRVKRSELIKRSTNRLTQLLTEEGIPFISMQGRKKNYYSIYSKMQRKNKSFHEIYDLIGLRIVVPEVSDCYQVLGFIHQHFVPKIGRLKDYIALPKSNGYQSIHTTVFGEKGHIMEIQIRTHDMHLENQYGIAAQYFYDQSGSSHKEKIQQKYQKKYSWVKEILEVQRGSSNNASFLDGLKLDVFKDRIFVFTPKGDVVDLPKGASVIDFAYHVHSDIGMLAESAEVNGRSRSLYYELKSGDVVNVVVSEASTGPQVEWLRQVKTNLAKNKIKEFLKEKDRNKLVQAGESQLVSTLKLFGLPGKRSLKKTVRMRMMAAFNTQNWEDLLYQIGRGLLDPRHILEKVYEEHELIGDQLAIEIEVKDRIGLLGDVSHCLGSHKVNILELHTIDRQRDKLTLYLILSFHNIMEYEEVMYSLRSIPGVVEVRREKDCQVPVEKIRMKNESA